MVLNRRQPSTPSVEKIETNGRKFDFWDKRKKINLKIHISNNNKWGTCIEDHNKCLPVTMIFYKFWAILDFEGRTHKHLNVTGLNQYLPDFDYLNLK